jgi:serine/threonine protein kinase
LLFVIVGLQDMCPNLDPLGLDLLGRMLVYDPQMRITARQALQHQYFHDIADLVSCACLLLAAALSRHAQML